MNFLFGSAIALVTVAFIFIVWAIVPNEWWAELETEWPWGYENRKLIRNTLAAILGAWVFFSAFATYGPRIELPQTHLPSPPSPQEAQKGENWSKSRDRWGEADKILQEAPERADITDPLEEEDEQRR